MSKIDFFHVNDYKIRYDMIYQIIVNFIIENTLLID